MSYFLNPINERLARLMGSTNDYSDREGEESYSASSETDSIVIEEPRRKKKKLRTQILDSLLGREPEENNVGASGGGGLAQDIANSEVGDGPPPPPRPPKPTLEELILELSKRLDVLEKGSDRKRVKPFIKVPNFNVPIKFSYSNAADLKVIETQYPKTKFVDGSKGSSIYDFLYLMREAHKNCPVNENDFKRILLNRLGGAALDLVSGYIEDKEPVSFIYTDLYETFSTTVETFEARELIRKYKAPRSFGIKQMLGELGMLGNIAGRGGSGPLENRFFISICAQDGLESALPEAAFDIVYNAICKERFIRGREPTFREIRECLGPEAEKIDRIIRKAKDFKFAPPRKPFTIVNKTKVHDKPGKKDVNSIDFESLDINKIDMHPPAMKGNPQGGKGKQGGKQTPKNGKNGGQKFVASAGGDKGGDKNPNKRPNSHTNAHANNKQNAKQNAKQTSETNRQKERLYCNFCGQFGHDSFMGCYQIVDDQYKQYEGPGTRDPCSICLKKISLSLHHPEAQCPARPFMIAAYKSGRLKPKGKYKTLPELQESSQ